MLRVLLGLAFAIVPTLASAHVGVGETHGAAHGFFHPLTGVDHILAMVAVGIFAAHVGGRGLWLIPFAFVSMMAAGGAFGLVGVAVPFVEIGIGLSVVALGLIVALQARPPVSIGMALVGFFALFHGHAHGAEMPDDASGLAYAMGFLAATSLLHAVGVGVGVTIEHSSRRYKRPIAQVLGGAMAVAGVAILGGAL